MLVFSTTLFWLVTVIVTGLAPQLNVTLPPPVQVLRGGEPLGAPHTSAAPNADSVQLAAVPVPTTASARTGRGDAAVNTRNATRTNKRRSITALS